MIKPSYVSNLSGSDFEDLGVVVELAGAIKEIAGVVVELAGARAGELVGTMGTSLGGAGELGST